MLTRNVTILAIIATVIAFFLGIMFQVGRTKIEVQNTISVEVAHDIRESIATLRLLNAGEVSAVRSMNERSILVSRSVLETFGPPTHESDRQIVDDALREMEHFLKTYALQEPPFVHLSEKVLQAFELRAEHSGEEGGANEKIGVSDK